MALVLEFFIFETGVGRRMVGLKHQLDSLPGLRVSWKVGTHHLKDLHCLLISVATLVRPDETPVSESPSRFLPLGHICVLCSTSPLSRGGVDNTHHSATGSKLQNLVFFGPDIQLAGITVFYCCKNGLSFLKSYPFPCGSGLSWQSPLFCSSVFTHLPRQLFLLRHIRL